MTLKSQIVEVVGESEVKNCFTHYDAKHFSNFFKEMIRIELKEEIVKYICI